MLLGETNGRSWHLRSRSVGQVDLAATSREFLLVLPRHGVELGVQFVARSSGERCRPIVLSLSSVRHSLPSIAVDVPDVNRKRFEEAQAASVEELADEPKRRNEVLE